MLSPVSGGGGDVQGRTAAVSRGLLLVSIGMRLTHVDASVVGEVVGKHALVLRVRPRPVGEARREDVRVPDLHGLHAEVLHRDGVARGGVRLAKLDANRQRAVALVRRDEHLDVVRSARGQAAAVERTVVVLVVAVEAHLVVGLVVGGHQVELDAVALVGLQRHAGGGIELCLPHATVVRVGRRLLDPHRRAVLVLRELDDVAVVMLLVHRVHAGVEGGRQRDVLEGHRDQLVDHLPGRNGPVQRIARGKRVGVLVDDLVHVDVTDDDHRTGAGLAKRELQDELVAVAIAGNHGLTGVHLAGN